MLLVQVRVNTLHEGRFAGAGHAYADYGHWRLLLRGGHTGLEEAEALCESGLRDQSREVVLFETMTGMVRYNLSVSCSMVFSK